MRLRALVSARVQEAAAIILQIISPRVHAILLKITRLRRRGRQLNACRIHTSPFFSRTCAYTRMRGFRYTRLLWKIHAEAVDWWGLLRAITVINRQARGSRDISVAFDNFPLEGKSWNLCALDRTFNRESYCLASDRTLHSRNLNT